MTNGPMGNGPGPRDGVPPPPCSPPPAAPAEVATADGDDRGPFRRTIRVVNPLGLHWRVAERFSRTAKGFASAVQVWHGEVKADGKSPMDLILLVALPGAELVLEVDGDDAPRAIELLTDILAAPGGEDYTL